MSMHNVEWPCCVNVCQTMLLCKKEGVIKMRYMCVVGYQLTNCSSKPQACELSNILYREVYICICL